MKSKLAFFCCLLFFVFVINAQNNNNTSGGLTDEEIQYLIEEEGLTQEEIDAFLNNGLSPEEQFSIDSALAHFRNEYNEEQLEDLLAEFDFQFPNIEDLSTSDLETLGESFEELISNLDLHDFTGLNLEATQIKESFLTFLETNSSFILEYAEIVQLFISIVDLVNNSDNLLEILKDELLPRVGPSGNLLELKIDREFFGNHQILKGELPPEAFADLENVHSQAFESNLPPEVTAIILKFLEID